MGLVRSILGLSETSQPADPDCWQMNDGALQVDLARAPELREPGGVLRLEGDGLPARVMVVHALDGGYHAFRSRRCQAALRLEPGPEHDRAGRDHAGRSAAQRQAHVATGAATKDLAGLNVERAGDRLLIEVDGDG